MISSNTKVNDFLMDIQSAFPDSFKTPSSSNAFIGDLVACLPNSKRFPIKAFGNDDILQKNMQICFEKLNFECKALINRVFLMRNPEPPPHIFDDLY